MAEQPKRLSVYTLGEFHVYCNGKSAVPERGKLPKTPLTLLKAIIALGGRSVSDTLLSDLIWPESKDPHKVLSVNLTRLRKLLAVKDALLQLDHKLTLNSKCCWVDALVFQNYCSPNRRIRQTAQLEDMLALYRGRFLPGDEEEIWSFRMREKLHGLFTSVLISHAQQLEKQNKWQEAARWYEYGLNQDDLYEPFYQGSMRCYFESAREAEALGFYYRCERLLNTQFARKPTPATQNLFQRILNHRQATITANM